MPRSLASGDYSLVMAIESGSRPNSWYRVLADRQSGALSCDCPKWIFNHNQRTCQHTNFAAALVSGTPLSRGATVHVSTTSPLLSATQQQWPGLLGTWQIEEADTRINTHPYRVVLLRLAPGNGGTATGVVAFAERHRHTEREMIAGVAGWAGYALAAEVARLGGFPMVGQPPEHFRVDGPQAGSRNRRQRPARDGAPVAERIGLADILRVGDAVDQGDGLRPEQRAENTLRLFMGETLYQQLEGQGYIDVSSVRFASEQRVYRLRRDPHRRRERRVRVFEHGRYTKDFCIVCAQDIPEADHLLTVALMLLSDEEAALSVVGRHNIFTPYSDDPTRESVPAVWKPRPTA